MASHVEENTEKKNLAKNRFGWGPFTPGFLQGFNKVEWFVVWMSCFYLLEELSHSLVNIAITTLERRYGLTSSQTGFMVTAHHIGGLIVVVPVSYMGAKGHKPRYLAIGTFIVGIGCFLFMVPQIISDVFDYTDTGVSNTTVGHVCESARTPNDILSTGAYTDDDDTSRFSQTATLFFPIFVIAEFILGTGDTPATTLAAPYIDENLVNKGKTSLYLGIYFAVGAIGAAVGYVAGGQSLTIYVDFTRVDMDELTITQDDAYWIGAWWLSFVACCIAFPMVACMISAYPKRLPTAPPPKVAPQKTKEEEATETRSVQESGDESKRPVLRRLGSRLYELIESLSVLFRNPTFDLLVLGGCAQALIAIGMLPFQAKILQEKFNISATEAGVILSVVSVVGQGGGEILGGVIMKVWNLGPKGILRFMSAFAAIAACFSACFFITCPDIKIAGVNIRYGSSTFEPPTDGLNGYCHALCQCDNDFYQPVCGTDDVVYITPCHAGCATEHDQDGDLSYSECSCVQAVLDEMASQLNATAENGRCYQDCQPALIAYSALLLLQFLTLFATVPAASVMPLRCVQEENRGMAVGVQWTFLRLLGVLPGPVMAGVVIDSSCSLWGSEGSCLLYDKDTLSWRIFLCWVIFQAFVVGIWALAAQIYRPEWAGQENTVIPSPDVELEMKPPTEKYGTVPVDENPVDSDSAQTETPQPQQDSMITSLQDDSPPVYQSDTVDYEVQPERPPPQEDNMITSVQDDAPPVYQSYSVVDDEPPMYHTQV